MLYIALLLVAACRDKVSRLPYYNTPNFTPLFLTPAVAADRITHKIRPFSFTDQYGQQVSHRQLRGKIHVANFIFTNCGSICPVMTQHMKLLQQAFAQDTAVVLLSYSVTPWIDSVPKLRRYAQSNGITSPRWHLLTGDKNEIYSLARQSYFAEEDLGFSKDSTDFLHTEHVLLVDDELRIRGIYNGTLQLDMEQLIADIKSMRAVR